MDLTMPGLNGIEATRQILAQAPGAKVIALSAHGDHRMVAETLKAGAMGYTLKDSAYEELVLAIRTVRSGKLYLSPRLVGSVVDHYVRRDAGEDHGAFAKLTPREREVLQLMAEGKSTKEVASGLGVSTKTVETHRRQIMDKLDMHSVAELTKYAIREGLTSLEH
jgi:DNA-binding NarL/FixJ family response regulator